MADFKKNIEYYASERPEIASIFPENVNTVLDVGCGAGNLGRHLKKSGVSEVVGIEISDEAAKLAEKNIHRPLNIDEHAIRPVDLGIIHSQRRRQMDHIITASYRCR